MTGMKSAEDWEKDCAWGWVNIQTRVEFIKQIQQDAIAATGSSVIIPDGYVVVRQEFIDYMTGKKSLGGFWLDEAHQMNRRGKDWYERYFSTPTTTFKTEQQVRFDALEEACQISTKYLEDRGLNGEILYLCHAIRAFTEKE